MPTARKAPRSKKSEKPRQGVKKTRATPKLARKTHVIKAEAALHLYRSLVEGMDQGVFILTTEGIVQYANQRLAIAVRLRREQIVGDPFSRFVSPSSRVHFGTLLKQAQQSSSMGEIDLCNVDGEVWPVLLSLRCIPEGGGYVRGVVTDLSDQRQVERGRRESEEQFRALAENSPDMIARFDSQGRILYVNPVLSRMTGKPGDAFVGSSLVESGLTIDVGTFWHYKIQQVFESGQPTEIEFEFPSVNGMRFLESRVAPERAADGSVASVVIVSRDVTERRMAEERVRRLNQELEQRVNERTAELQKTVAQLEAITAELEVANNDLQVANEELRVEAEQRSLAESALRESESRFRAVLENSLDAVYRRNLKTDAYDYVSPAIEQLTGFSAHEFSHLKFEEVLARIHPEDQSSARQALARAQSGSKSAATLEYRFMDKYGNYRWLADRFRVIRDAEEHPLYSVGNMRDIGEAKLRETLRDAQNATNVLVHSTLDPDEIMRRALAEAARVLECDTAAISLREQNHWVVRYTYGFQAGVVGLTMKDEEERHAVLAIQTRKPVAIDDALHDERANAEHMQKWGIRSVLVVPLLAKDQALGVLFFNYQRLAFVFRDLHIDFATKLAASLGQALENARLFASLQAEVKEHQEAERALNESQSLLRAFLEGAPDPVYVKDRDSRILLTNPALARVVGKPVEEIVGKTDDECYGNPAVGQIVREHDLAVMASGRSEVFEETVPTVEGERIFLSSKAPRRTEEGDIIGIVGVSRDITRRKQAEQALIEHMWNLEILSNSATHLLGLQSSDDLFRFTAEELQKVAGRAIVVVNAYDINTSRTTVQAVKSPEDKAQKLTALLGQDPRGLAFTVAEGILARIIGGRLVQVEGGLFDLTFKQWPLSLCQRLEEELELGDVYAMPFVHSEDFIGTVAILTDKTEGLRNRSLIELLVSQVGLALKHRHVEKALRKSEEHYRTLFNGMSEGFALHEVICDDKGEPIDYRFLEINPAFERLTGLRREEVIGKTHNEVLPNDDPRWVKAYGAVALTGTPIQFENYSPPLQKHYEVLAYRPAPRQFAVTFVDITERKARESELRRINRILKALSDIGQTMMRAENEVEYLKQVCRIVVEDCGHAMVWIGYADQDEGKRVRPVASAGFEEGYLETLKITWDDTERGQGPTGTAIRTGKPSGCRNMLTDPRFRPWREEALRRGYGSSIVLPLKTDGSTFGALCIYSKEPDAFTEDEVTLLGELAEDLSLCVTAIRLREAHSRAERALRQSEERYRQLVELSPDGICMHRRGIVEFINTAGTRLLGAANPAEILGRPILDFVHPDFRQVVQERVRSVGEKKESVPLLEEKFLRLDGSSLDVEAVAIPFGEGSVQVVFRDITERKRVQEQVESLHLALERRATELEATNKELEAFSYSVSHDLRMPLAQIDAFTRLVLEDYGAALPSGAEPFLRLIQDNAASMQRLIEDLLSFSRTSRQPVKKQTVSPKDIVTQALEELRPAQAGRNVECTLGDLSPCEADPILLKQVYVNLLSNALKFTRTREVAQIEIGCGPCDGEQIVYYVRDNGVGFDMDQAERLFGVFQRFHHADEYEGNGVGLAIVQRIITRHGGRVWAEAAVDQGATFYFTLGG